MPASHDRSPTDKRPGVVSVFWMLLDSIRRAGVALLARPFRVLVLWYRDLRFARRMREEGRFMPWPQLKPRLLKGEGTLIVEQARSERMRVWWTPGKVLQPAPKHQPPSEDELDYERRDQPHPFVAWCYEQYLDPKSGRAMLTQPPYDYPGGIVKAVFFKCKCQAPQVVMTVRLE